jgi:hypothetical protein
VSFGRLVVLDGFSICLYETISRLFSTVNGIIRCSFDWGTLWSPSMGVEEADRFRNGFLRCFDGTLCIPVRSFAFLPYEVISRFSFPENSVIRCRFQ